MSLRKMVNFKKFPPLPESIPKCGRLTVVSTHFRYSRQGIKLPWADCRCDCGAITVVRVASLRAGKTKSCGCLQLEAAMANKPWRRTHNLSGTREYETWASMKNRCQNPRAIHWEWYGGRGISVCDRWQKFENFYADMGRRPEGMSLDRIDVNGNYEPGNCRWATMAVQLANRRPAKRRGIPRHLKCVEPYELAYGF